jgi:hypothetical protein
MRDDAVASDGVADVYRMFEIPWTSPRTPLMAFCGEPRRRRGKRRELS